MTPRTITAEPEAWERLARAVRDRRADEGLTADDVIQASKGHTGKGVSRSVISLVENARKTSYAERSLRALSVGLGWTSDSAQRVLEGLIPMPTAKPDDPSRLASAGPALEQAFEAAMGLLDDTVEELNETPIEGSPTIRQAELVSAGVWYGAVLEALAKRIVLATNDAEHRDRLQTIIDEMPPGPRRLFTDEELDDMTALADRFARELVNGPDAGLRRALAEIVAKDHAMAAESGDDPTNVRPGRRVNRPSPPAGHDDDWA